MSYGKPGDRMISEEDYEALNKALEEFTKTSKQLDQDVEALAEVVKKCCPHRGTEKIAS